MMIDWQDKVDRAQLICARSGQAIAHGDSYISCLTFADGQFQRHDYATAVWTDEDADQAVSWWKHRRPEALKDTGPRIVNHQVLLGIFHDLKDSTNRHQQCFAWLISLLLMRAKKLRYLDLKKEDGKTFFLLEEKTAKVVHKLRDPQMTAEEEEAVQDNLAQIFDMP